MRGDPPQATARERMSSPEMHRGVGAPGMPPPGCGRAEVEGRHVELYVATPRPARRIRTLNGTSSSSFEIAFRGMTPPRGRTLATGARDGLRTRSTRRGSMANERPAPPRRADRVTPARTPGSSDGVGPASGNQPPQRMPPRRTWLSFLIILLINVAIVRLLFPGAGAPAKVPYTLFREQVTAHNVQAIYSRGSSITGRFIKPITYPRDTTGGGRPAPVSDFATEVPSFVDPGLETLLIDNGVEISAEADSAGQRLARRCSSASAPALLIIALYVWMFRRAAKQGGGLGGMLGGDRQEQGAPLRPGRRTTGSRSRTSPASTRPRTSSSRSSISCKRSAEVHAPRRHRAEGRAAGRRAGHGQDAARARRRRRSGRAVLLDERRRSSSR